MTTAADIVIDSLIGWGVDTIFGIPGDGNNSIIESIRKRKNEIKFILTRHEESAAFMACAYSKYTNKLGVCLATTGPGATNLTTGLYDAKLDNTPIIAITGTTYSDLVGSGYQQDIGVMHLFADVSEYNNRINSPEHAKMVTDNACRLALSRRGVSHITIPIDIQSSTFKGKYSTHKQLNHTSQITTTHVPPKKSLEQAVKILNSGKNIVILVGQGALDAKLEVQKLAKKLNAPVVKALLGKAVIPDNSKYSLGGLGMLGTEPSSNAMKNADTLLMIGTSFPYLEYLPKPGSVNGIQIDINPEKIGLRYPVEVGLVGDSKKTIKNILPLIKQKRDKTFLLNLQKNMQEWNKTLEIRSSKKGDSVKPQSFASILSDLLNDDAIISVDSGTITTWAARYIHVGKKTKFSLSGTLASMACAVPYSIAAQIGFPKRQSIAFIGDGGMAMLLGEFSTAVKYNLPIKVFVIKNNALNMIRWEQMAFSGNPEFAVEFEPIDFTKIADACGAKGFTIKKDRDVKKTIKQALSYDGPVIVEVYVDPFEAPIPPKVNMEFIQNVVSSFAKGQPNATKIALSLLGGQIKEKIKKRTK